MASWAAAQEGWRNPWSSSAGRGGGPGFASAPAKEWDAGLCQKAYYRRRRRSESPPDWLLLGAATTASTACAAAAGIPPLAGPGTSSDALARPLPRGLIRRIDLAAAAPPHRLRPGSTLWSVSLPGCASKGSFLYKLRPPLFQMRPGPRRPSGRADSSHIIHHVNLPCGGAKDPVRPSRERVSVPILSRRRVVHWDLITRLAPLAAAGGVSTSLPQATTRGRTGAQLPPDNFDPSALTTSVRQTGSITGAPAGSHRAAPTDRFSKMEE